MKYIVTILSLALAASSADAEVWTLDRCIDYAIGHNISVKSRLADKEASEIDVSSAKAAYLPTLSAGASQSWNFGRGLTAENIYANRNTSNTQFDASLNLPVFSGLANERNLRLSRINLMSVVEQYEAAKEDVTLNVISAYLQVLYTKELHEVALQQVALSEYELTRREALLEAGKIPEVDMLEARSQLAQDELSSTTTMNDYTLALVDLAQLLELDGIEGMEVAPLEENPRLLISADEVYRNALATNHGIKAAEYEVRAARQQIAVAQTGYIPTLSFNAGLGSSYYSIHGLENKSFSQQMKDNFNSYVGFSLRIPIFDALSTRNRVKKARVQQISSQLQLDDRRKQLHKAITQAYYQAVGAQKKEQSGIIAEDAAAKAFEAMSEKYSLGRATPTDYEQAKTKYLRATSERIQAKYEHILRCRILDFYNGN